MKRILLFTTVSLFYSIFSFGQDRSNYELLWQITKDDHPEKSYLFGTMHVKDSRAFQFPDALIPAIKNTEVFALEIDPEEATNEMIDSFVSYGNKNRFKDALSKEEYQLLKERFYLINEIDIDSFNTQHPYMITAMLQKDLSKPTDKRTFLDAYLYSIAYQYDKDVVGLEDIEDQFPEPGLVTNEELRDNVMYYLKNNQEEQDEYLETLHQIYYEGDLKKINDFVNNFDVNDLEMKSRNIKMATNMDSIMQSKSLFSAIGAAHLSGTYGVIDLLIDKGYTLTPVPATFINKDQKFELIPKTEKWITNTYPELGYSVKTPTTGSKIPMSGRQNLNNVIDLLSGNEFSYFGFDTSQRTYSEGFDMVEEMIKSQLEKEDTKLVSRNTFTKGDFEVTEIIADKKNKANRLQIYFNNRFVYMFHVEGALDEISAPYVNAYFDSITLFDPVITKPTWSTHTEPMGAYSVAVFGEIEDLSRTTPSPSEDGEEVLYDLKLFRFIDVENQVLGLMRYNDQPNGYYLQNQSLFEDEFIEFFKKLGKVIGDPEITDFYGHEMYTYKILVGEKYNAIAKVIFRGNRTYLQLAQSLIPNAPLEEDYRFFKSLKFEDFKNESFKAPTLINDKYQISFLGEVKKTDIIEYEDNAEFEYTYNYQCIDETTGGSHILQWTKLKKYAKGTSKKEYLSDYAQQILEYNDTILSEKDVTLEGQQAKQFSIYNPKTNVKQELTLLIHDDNILTILSYVGQEEINRASLFAEKFKVLDTEERFDLTALKSKEIFKALKSKDSIPFYKAEGAFDYYVFDPEENNILLKNLNNAYLDDDKQYGVKYQIIDELATLNQEASFVKLLKFYNKQKEGSLKIHTLKNLGAFTQLASVEMFLDILQNNLPVRDDENSFSVLDKIPNDAEFIKENEAILTTLLDNDNLRDQLVSNYRYHILNDSIYKDQVPTFTKKLQSYFIEDTRKYIDTTLRYANPHINYSLIGDYLYIIKQDSLKDANAIETLMTLADGNDTQDWRQISALQYALNQNIAVPTAILNKRLEALYSRFEVMESLIENNKVDAIPSKFLEPESFSKLSLYNAIGYDYDYYPDQINYLGEITHNGSLYHAFNYIMEEGDEVKLLGYAKSDTIDLDNLEAFETIVTDNEINEDWKKQVLKLLNEE